MISQSSAASPVRYVDTVQIRRDLEVEKNARFALNSGPSFFLAHGLEGARPGARPRPNLTPLIVPKSEVARLSAQRLSAEADRAGAEIEKELTPLGLKVVRGDGVVTRPIASKHLVHLCETLVCYIPYATKAGKGRLVVKMTNFASGIAVPTRDGLHYRDVVPMRNTALERNTFRVLGIHVDADGTVIGIDPRFTANGIAWSVDSHQAITEACKRRVLR